MYKVFTLIALVAIGCAAAQESGGESNSAPEPYAYAYQTDSSSASEQRTPDGKVTGYYTIADATDGRERRVEYVADENGFRAKVATNELGTKSGNSADVEVYASPASEAQLYAYQQNQQQFKSVQYPYQQQQQQVVTTAYQQTPQRVNTVYSQQVVPQQQQYTTSSTYYKQQPGVYRQQYVYYNQQPGVYGYGYPSSYGYGSNQNVVYGGYGPSGANYNYHTPAQYYSGVQGSRYVQTTSGVQPVSYTVGGNQGGVVSRYVTTTGGVRNVPVGYTYSSAPVATTTRTVTTSSSGGSNLGSGNLLVLKK